MDEFIPMRDGDLRWAFPGVRDAHAAAEELQAADGRLERIAVHLGLSAGGRLGYERCEGITLTGVFGAVGVPGVRMAASAFVPRRCLHGRRAGPPWMVTAYIEVDCAEYGEDCGSHEILCEEEEFDDPDEAARALAGAAGRLLGEVLARPAAYWRALPASADLPGRHA
ncbi:hypothetical protein [Kitasatospora sp. KL5]|uniref:hypothetical protein n=1 Tax=Kitasatospora sp. KL5 TaxID=3425125 RepID=UPI003D6FB923